MERKKYIRVVCMWEISLLFGRKKASMNKLVMWTYFFARWYLSCMQIIVTEIRVTISSAWYKIKLFSKIPNLFVEYEKFLPFDAYCNYLESLVALSIDI